MSSSLLIKTIKKSLRSVLPDNNQFYSLHEPSFNGNEWKYMKECLDTGWVSSVGKFVDRFEVQLAEFTGAKYAVAIVNGTAALHICLKLSGVEANDEVLIPTLTFIATANAAVYCGAIPHFIDSEIRTLGLDPFKLENYLSEITEIKNNECFNKKTGRRIKAVVPMHTFGHPVDMDALIQVCERFSITVIEDAAESLGSYYKGYHTGSQGYLSALSFNGNKIITTGGGGAILTNDEFLAKQAKHLTTTAKLPHKWEYVHDRVGYNYRLPNINAALGCAQLEQLPEFLKKKRTLAERYRKAFENVEGVTFFVEPEFARSNYWLNAILLNEEDIEFRDRILDSTKHDGIMTRPVWKLMHKLEIFGNCPRSNMTTSESIERRLINIPSSAGLIAF